MLTWCVTLFYFFFLSGVNFIMKQFKSKSDRVEVTVFTRQNWGMWTAAFLKVEGTTVKNPGVKQHSGSGMQQNPLPYYHHHPLSVDVLSLAQ